MKKFSLESHPKVKRRFEAPEDYFDTLPDRVMTAVSRSETKVVRLSPDRSWVWAAASILLLSLSLPIINKMVDVPQAADSVSIESYLLTQSDISSYELAESLEITNLDHLQVGLDPEKIESALYYQDVEYYLNYR